MNYNYYTQDGHLMVEGETMWRICCSQGFLFTQPINCVFSQNTGYNSNFEKINENQIKLKSVSNLNPYAANHLHYFSKEEAERQLALRSK